MQLVYSQSCGMMRPDILFPLFAEIDSLPGVGPKRREALAQLLRGDRIRDVLFHLPSGYRRWMHAASIAEAPMQADVILRVQIDKHIPGPPRGRQPYRVRCSDASGFLDLVFFHAKGDYLKRTFPEGESRMIAGRLEDYRGGRDMVHPAHILPVNAPIPVQEPQYPLSAAFSQRQIQHYVMAALERLPKLPEWIEPSLFESRKWPAFGPALRGIHHPEREQTLEWQELARERLSYDEILAQQLALLLLRGQERRGKAKPLPAMHKLTAKLRELLPFQLTGGQEEIVHTISEDMQSPQRMLRLLQGDVGSGKTVVALMAMLQAVENGHQAVLMAPTAILARQHQAFLSHYAELLGLRAEVLTGADKGKRRTELLQALKAGKIHLLVGTHAVFQDDVEYHSLALAIIDEQHRFGVQERLRLTQKGQAHILLMTATPIPRSYTLALYGDMDCSRLTEKPANRKPIDTRVLPLSRLQEVMGSLQRALNGGAKIYWICPLVEESESIDLAAAEERHETLRVQYGEKVGLVHGRMKAPERDEVMRRFAGSEHDILVATTVIEVGVDVPEATVIVIEHAERFGLAQLHQLRGRVGRSDRASSCLLLYADGISETGIQRLRIMRETNDGFRIAEEDLNIRGGGELLGTRQSGMPQFRIADTFRDKDLFSVAHDDARLALNQDAALQSPRGQALRNLLYLFGHDEHVAYLRSG